MRQAKPRTYSRRTKETAVLLGKLILLARKERRMTAEDVSARAGITRNTLRKIENGDLKCEIGLVFEVAAIVGVPLFLDDPISLRSVAEYADDKLVLLPKRTRRPRKVDDDF